MPKIATLILLVSYLMITFVIPALSKSNPSLFCGGLTDSIFALCIRTFTIVEAFDFLVFIFYPLRMH